MSSSSSVIILFSCSSKMALTMCSLFCLSLINSSSACSLILRSVLPSSSSTLTLCSSLSICSSLSLASPLKKFVFGPPSSLKLRSSSPDLELLPLSADPQTAVAAVLRLSGLAGGKLSTVLEGWEDSSEIRFLRSDIWSSLRDNSVLDCSRSVFRVNTRFAQSCEAREDC